MQMKMARHYPLADLIRVSEGFIFFAEALRRNLLLSEKKEHHWILAAWDKPGIQKECRHITDQQGLKIAMILARLLELFHPKPIRVQKVDFDTPTDFITKNAKPFMIRIGKSLKGETQTISKGNHKTIFAPLAGVRNRQMTNGEATERLGLLNKTISTARYLMNELSLYYGAKQPIPTAEVKMFEKLGRKFEHLGRQLAKALDPHNMLSGTLPLNGKPT